MPNRKKSFRVMALLITVLVLIAPGVCAAVDGDDEATDATDPALLLKGFGSLVATRTSDAGVGWQVQNQPRTQAQSHAGDWTFSAESLIGLQADIFSQRTWSGTVQVIAMNRHHGDPEPALELAFLRYEISPEWRLRLGRIWTPSFMNSETRYVGYANTTVRNTNYTLYQITNLDGGDLRLRTRLGQGNLVAGGYLGANRYQLPDNASGQDDYFKLPFIGGGFLAWETDRWLLRGSYTKIDLARRGTANVGKYDARVADLQAQAVAGTCDLCAQEADKWANVWDGTDYRVATLSSKFTAPRWSLAAEVVQRTTNGVFPDTLAWDLEFNYLAGPLTYYADYLRASTRSNNRPVASLDAVSSGISAFYAQGRIDRSITTLGLKYHASETWAVRAEVADIRFSDPQAGVGFAPKSTGVVGLPSRYQLFSLSLDFLF